MEVPDLADSWQPWLSVPSLDVESTFSANAKHDPQADKRFEGKDVRDEAW